MSVKLYFARALNGALVDVTRVERGLACECRCLHCDDVLMAKQGPEMAWHFAHATPKADRSCAESALHQAAKALLSEIGALTLPALSTTLSAQDALDREHDVEASLPAAPFVFDRVELEHSVEARRLDALVSGAQGRLGIEIKVTHEVDERKAEDLTRCGYPVVEIDLSALLNVPVTREDLKGALKETAPRAIVAGDGLLLAPEVSRAKIRLADALAVIREKAERASDLTGEERMVRERLAAEIKLRTDVWPKDLEWAGWMRNHTSGPSKVFGVHHSVWQCACMVALQRYRDADPVGVDRIVLDVANLLQYEVTEDELIETSVGDFLHGPARSVYRIVADSHERWRVPADFLQDEAIERFARLRRQGKSNAIARWLKTAGLAQPPVYRPHSEPMTGALQVAPAVWQTHVWLVWIHGRVQKPLHVQDFIRWVKARYR